MSFVSFKQIHINYALVIIDLNFIIMPMLKRGLITILSQTTIKHIENSKNLLTLYITNFYSSQTIYHLIFQEKSSTQYNVEGMQETRQKSQYLSTLDLISQRSLEQIFRIMRSLPPCNQSLYPDQSVTLFCLWLNHLPTIG